MDNFELAEGSPNKNDCQPFVSLRKLVENKPLDVLPQPSIQKPSS